MEEKQIIIFKAGKSKAKQCNQNGEPTCLI